jgi:hypothetical protein
LQSAIFVEDIWCREGVLGHCLQHVQRIELGQTAGRMKQQKTVPIRRRFYRFFCRLQFVNEVYDSGTLRYL